jgi:hypothetical protein
MKFDTRVVFIVLMLVIILFFVGLLIWLFRCQCSDVVGDRGRPAIVFQEAAVSVWDDRRTLGSQLQLKNVASTPAEKVRVVKIEIDGGVFAGPTALPSSLGDLEAQGGDAIMDAIFKLNAPADGAPRLVRVTGDYKLGWGREDFSVDRTINPAVTIPGPFSGKPGVFTKQAPKLAQYPIPPAKTSAGPNAETPIFVPIGPPRQLFPPTPKGTSVGTIAGGAGIEIPVNTSLTNAGVPPDANAAATSNGVAIATYNTGVSVSTDGGQTFTDIPLFSPQPGNPARTSFFPQSDGGLCCDQVIVYLTRQNLFVWLLQYNPITACVANCPPQPPGAPPPTAGITQASRLRVAWATPAAIAADFWNAWTYGDLTGTNVTGVSSGLGINNNEWLDYPDLAWSDDFLYVGVDHGSTTPGQVWVGRRIVARLSLADMANPASTVVNYSFTELTGSNGLNKTHFVQGAPRQMVVGSLDNSSTMRIFTWRDGDANVSSPATVGISQIQQGAAYTSLAPDSADWVAVGFPGNISGAAFRRTSIGLGAGLRDEYLFAFTAGKDSAGRPQPYVRLETLTPDGGGFKAFEEYDIWNSDFAFAMAGIGSMFTEVGITLGLGGGTIGFPQHAVGFKDDFVVYPVTASDATQVIRFGDYFSNRWIPGTGRFATEVYDVLLNPLPAGVTSGSCSTVGCAATMRYVEYGRPPLPPIR